MNQIEDVDVLTFKEAIKDSEKFKTRHLLLGNGFSIACSGTFKYPSLFEAADFPSDSHLSKVFENLDPKDFEKAIRRLEDASKILPIYDGAASATAKMAEDAEALKNILVSTITDTHPDKFDFNGADFPQCRRNFLCHFLGPTNKGGNIYTLNYDLLLYWATRDDRGFLGRDGFWPDSDSGDITWKSTNPQTVHYLHGALHLFDTGTYLGKITGKDNLTILPQVRNEILSGRYPLFVAEGESKQKLEKIRGNEYLRDAYDNFKRQMKEPNDSLFIFGHSLDETDDHIFDCIIKGKIPRVYVSLHGDPNSVDNKKIIKKAEEWVTLRTAHYPSDEYPLEVKFFDAESAEVWRQKSTNSK